MQPHKYQRIILRTERLILEPVSAEWREEIFREFTEEVTVFMTPVSPKEITETDVFIRLTQKNMDEGKEIIFAILEKKTREFLGCAGLHEIQSKTPEMGVWIKKSKHGHRYGREAMTALKEWADQNLHYDHIIYPVDRDNIASRKIPESLGGKVRREYNKVLANKTLHTVEYWIPPSS